MFSKGFWFALGASAIGMSSYYGANNLLTWFMAVMSGLCIYIGSELVN
jgi:hypothetical protein